MMRTGISCAALAPAGLIWDAGMVIGGSVGEHGGQQSGGRTGRATVCFAVDPWGGRDCELLGVLGIVIYHLVRTQSL